MEGNETDKTIRSYLSMRYALEVVEDTNSLGLNVKGLEVLLTLGNCPEGHFTEKNLGETFGYSPSTVSDLVKSLTEAEVVKKLPFRTGVLRRGKIELTDKGKEAYNKLSERLLKAVGEDPFSRLVNDSF